VAEYLGNDATTTLNGSINNSVTSITVTSGTGFPTPNFRIRIDNELMLVTSVGGGTNWTVTRGVEGTTAASHSNGASLAHVVTVAGLGQWVQDGLSGGPGGVAANKVYASPNGASGFPSFRSLVAADVPTLNQDTTGLANKATTVWDDGTYSGSAAYRNPSGMYVYYAYLGRIVYNNAAYSGSGWVEPSDLGVRYANSAGSVNGSVWCNMRLLWTGSVYDGFGNFCESNWGAGLYMAHGGAVGWYIGISGNGQNVTGGSGSYGMAYWSYDTWDTVYKLANY
jgi:hypothetical protein